MRTGKRELARGVSEAAHRRGTWDEITEEKIALRAYQKWQQRGCPLWDGETDWFAARAELEQERGNGDITRHAA